MTRRTAVAPGEANLEPGAKEECGKLRERFHWEVVGPNPL